MDWTEVGEVMVKLGPLFKKKPNGGTGAGPYRDEPPEQQIARLREQVAGLQAELEKRHEPNLDLARQLAESQAAVERLGKESSRYSRQATEYRNSSLKANDSLREAERRIKHMQGSQGSMELLGMELQDLPKNRSSHVNPSDALNRLFAKGQQSDLIDALLVFLREPMEAADRAVWDAYVAGALGNGSTKEALCRAYKAFKLRPSLPHKYETEAVEPRYDVPTTDVVYETMPCSRCGKGEAPIVADALNPENMGKTTWSKWTCPCGAIYKPAEGGGWTLKELL